MDGLIAGIGTAGLFFYGLHILGAGISCRGKVKRIALDHVKALGLKWRQLVVVDAYGGENQEAWFKECKYFLRTHVEPALNDLQVKWLRGNGFKSGYVIVGTVARSAAHHMAEQDTLPPDASPTDYEQYCADILRRHGWSAVTTATTGDQGIDIIAEKGGLRVVLQCKKYSGSVGNEAVQQAIAGGIFGQADKAAVVSPAPYTISAQQLASAAGVLLLHHSQLADLDRLCRIKARRIA